MMAVLTIAGLIWKEAVRKRTLWGALCMGLLILALSLLPLVVKHQMLQAVDAHRMSYQQFAWRFPIVRSMITTLCLGVIKALGAIFAVMLAGGAISGEIERGLMAVILSKPIPRWQILLGKWVGINLVLCSSLLVWAILVWVSLSLQVRENWYPILLAGLLLMLFPLMASTITLTLSTVSQRLLGTSLAVVLMAIGWLDGIFNLIGQNFNAPIVEAMARFMSILMPQSVVSWWIEEVMEPITSVTDSPRAIVIGQSPTFIRDWGVLHLHIAHLDAIYLTLYILFTFAAGVTLFQRRDI